MIPSFGLANKADFLVFDTNYVAMVALSIMAISLQERANLIILHSTPRRHYHTWNHIEQCYRIANEIYDGHILSEIEYAICYHDSVYDPYSKTNEEDSARLFLQEHMITKEDCLNKDLVVSCILNTKNHFADTSVLKYQHTVNAFLDIDLSILATDEEYYISEYSNLVEKEYCGIPSHLYREGRKKFLEKLLNVDRIYKTEYMKKFESKAKNNIKKEIKRIEEWPFC